jgi:hypothetical protein
LCFAVLTLIWFGKVFDLKQMYVLLVLVLFTTQFGTRPFKYSWFDQVWIWPMNSYGIYELFSLILCVISYKILTSQPEKISLREFSFKNKFLLLPFFAFGLNHNRGLFEIYGPIFFTLLALSILHTASGEQKKQKNYSNLLISSLICTILGRLLITLFSYGVAQTTQQPSQTFTPLDSSNFVSKMFSPFLTIFQVFGVNPTPGLSVFSTHGLRILSLFALVVLLVLMPVSTYLKSSRYQELNLGGKFMFLHLIYFVIVSFVTSIFTSSAGEIRYSIPLAISAIFFFPYVLSHSKIKQKILLSILIALLIPSIGNGVQKLVLKPGVDFRETSNYKLTQSLLERNVTFGFAGPWRDDVLAVPFYSAGRIRIGVIEPDTLGPHGHADKSWFLESHHHAKTFLTIPTSLIPTSPRFPDFLSIAIESYEVDKWTVLIFEDNPAYLVGRIN